MAKRYTLRSGESSFDGIHPATKEFCGVAFGYHNLTHNSRCAECDKTTNYAIHRRYKFSRNLEKNEKVERLWCCSNECFKIIVFKNMFDLVLPFSVSEAVLSWEK